MQKYHDILCNENCSKCEEVCYGHPHLEPNKHLCEKHLVEEPNWEMSPGGSWNNLREDIPMIVTIAIPRIFGIKR